MQIVKYIILFFYISNFNFNRKTYGKKKYVHRLEELEDTKAKTKYVKK